MHVCLYIYVYIYIYIYIYIYYMYMFVYSCLNSDHAGAAYTFAVVVGVITTPLQSNFYYFLREETAALIPIS